MDRKELTSGEAEPVDYMKRFSFYSTMELFIETLTGTCFELRVSPFETVISVKAKIQRLEGIPISQQYLIWQNMELDDEYCLHDYSITDGCTLKLVLAMRGGPINTRRIAMDEPSFREMAEYVDANQEEFFESLSTPPSAGNNGSNKQVTLLVYRDGDELSFFRVVDRGDGTLTPLSESLSGGSISNMEEEEEGEVSRPQKWSVSQVIENNITASKMRQLRSHMHNLNIKGSTSNKKAKPPNLDETPSSLSQEKNDSHTSSKLSLVRRHLTFSPKDVTKPTMKELSKLPPTSLKTGSISSVGDLPPSQPLPQQPPPSAEEPKSPTLESTPPNFVASAKEEKRHSARTRVPSSKVKKGAPKESSLKSEGEISEGEITARLSKIAVKEICTSGSESPVQTTSSKMPSVTSTISKTDLLRARLNRIKQTMNSDTKEAGDSVMTDRASAKVSHKTHLPEATNVSAGLEKVLEKGKEVKKSENVDKNVDESSGKRSPRTRRLLAALTNNGKTNTATSSMQTTKKKLPVTTVPRFPSSLPHGMAFNRHDMYLRSYGLLASPDDEADDDIVKNLPSALSETTVAKTRSEEPVKASQSSKIMETPHGVKYTTTGRGPSYYSRPWYDHTPHSPVSATQRTQGPTVKDSSKLENPSSYSLFHPYNRDLKPIGRPQGPHPMPPSHPKLGSLEKLGPPPKHSYSSYGRPASNWAPDRVAPLGEAPTTTTNLDTHRWSGAVEKKLDKPTDKEGSRGHGVDDTPNNPTSLNPRPPSSTNTGVGALRYHGRRPIGNSKGSEKSHNPQSATSTTTSGVRMNDSPHRKIETISRQEAREVVDFINKAMDASILRSLVKSPGKETHRGSSGQSSYRHPPLPYHHYGDSSRHTTETGPKYTTSGSGRLGSKVEITPLGGPRIPTTSAHSRGDLHHPSASGLSLLPPVKTAASKKKRCFLCGKKTGLATSYICRCGNNFCATHRYAETHECTYDYKTRGRKLLEENNPLVSAPKLPKI